MHTAAYEMRISDWSSDLCSSDLSCYCLRDCLVPGGAYYSAKGSFSAHAPGCSYDYSNVGYALLGYLGSRVAGLDFRAYLQERLFRRLPMTGLAWRLGDVPLARRVIPYAPRDGRARPTQHGRAPCRERVGQYGVKP